MPGYKPFKMKRFSGFGEGTSPMKGYKSAAQRKAVHASKADGGKGNPNKMHKSMYNTSPAKAAKPDYIDIDKDGDKKEPMKKAAKDAKKKKMSMDEKVQLLNIGKQIREMAKQNGVQPSQFLGYLVAKNPEKYGPLAKLEDIIDGKG